MGLLELNQVRKTYPGAPSPVINIASFSLCAGQQVALRGRSGTGKSTLLHLIAGLLLADSGSIVLDGQALGSMKESQRDRYRGQKLGYVFQSFHLLQGLTVWENLWLAAALSGQVVESRLQDYLQRLDLWERRQHRPAQLSVGQQQRVAVARALVHQPKLVLADEPTGNLDAELAQDALSLLRALCQETGAALLLVSHDRSLLEQFEECLDLSQINQPC